jgi:hypothetical protein
MPPAADTAHRAGQAVGRIEILEAAANRAARYPRRPRRGDDPAMPGRARLRRCKKTTASLVQALTNRRKPFTYR